MLRWHELCSRSDPQLAGRDLIETNLACALDLLGGEGIDVPAYQRQVDGYAQQVGDYTVRMLPRYDRNPDGYGSSRNQFKILALVTVLQRDLGIGYREELKTCSDEAFYINAEHLFVHGILAGKGGSCPSLPVLYLAVGRRLGYPLKLVSGVRHLFARWDEPGGERFNIECTCNGFISHPDEDYLTWPEVTTPERAKLHGAFRSLTPRQELAHFMSLRGACLLENGRYAESVMAYGSAHELDPEDHGGSVGVERSLVAWSRKLQATEIKGFPSWRVYFPPIRWWPKLRLDLEQAFFKIVALEKMANDVGLEAAYWAPLRHFGRFSPHRPLEHIEVHFPPKGLSPLKVILFDKKPDYPFDLPTIPL
jgi:hypothetical protein